MLQDVSVTVDGPRELTVHDASGQEGQEGSVDFTVRLSQASENQVRVNWMTWDRSAKDFTDYHRGSGTLTFEPGETEKTASVWLVDDDENESTERFYVMLQNPRGAGSVWHSLSGHPGQRLRKASGVCASHAGGPGRGPAQKGDTCPNYLSRSGPDCGIPNPAQKPVLRELWRPDCARRDPAGRREGRDAPAPTAGG